MTPSDILDFIQNSPAPVSKREIAKGLRLKGAGPRVALKQILKQLKDEGTITKHKGGLYGVPAGLPPVCMIEVTDIDADGDVFAKPVDWNTDLQGAPPRIEVMPDKKGHHPSLGVKDRVLARLSSAGPDAYEAVSIRKIDKGAEARVMGVLVRTKRGAILQPSNKKAKHDFDVLEGDLDGAVDGDLVVGEILPARGLKRKQVRIIEIIGQRSDPKAISLISLHEAGIEEAFPEDVMKETTGMSVPDVKGREDLRDIPLVTIDGADARDFDDAVFAEKTDDGFHLIVAIADVANYVRHGSALDTEAQKRGNSTYFPDRVVPMLPEALSNDLCSLRPNENRACLAVHMYIDMDGTLKSYKFVRGLMRSAARLTYEQVQHERDAGKGDHLPMITPLYEAYAVLDQARIKRGSLDLDLPEKQIMIDDQGNMTGVQIRERLDAHKLIEEFMVLANVAAATALEAKRDPKQFPCVYRIHDQPSLEKLESAREFIESFGLSLPKGQVTKPGQINQVLRKAAELPYSHLISIMVLRTQSQAVYSTENIGHFGLALSRYGHFTSPIRRYADLLIHRSLIGAYGLGPGGLVDEERARINEICEHISTTERVSMVAERNSVDRFTAAFLSDHIGANFEGKITGVTRFGLFVSLDESGADGLVPMRSLPDDFYIHDEKAHALIGKRRKKVYRLGARVTVKLKEADGMTGSCVLEMAGESLKGADIPGVPMPGHSDRRTSRSQDHSSKRHGGKPHHSKKPKRTTPKHKRKAKNKKPS